MGVGVDILRAKTNYSVCFLGVYLSPLFVRCRGLAFPLYCHPHGILSCGVAVVCWSWLTTCFRIMFWSNQVSMGVTVATAIFFPHRVLFLLVLPVLLRFIALISSSICLSFALIWLLNSFTVFVRFWSDWRSDAVAVARFASASAVSCSGLSLLVGGWH